MISDSNTLRSSRIASFSPSVSVIEAPFQLPACSCACPLVKMLPSCPNVSETYLFWATSGVSFGPFGRLGCSVVVYVPLSPVFLLTLAGLVLFACDRSSPFSLESRDVCMFVCILTSRSFMAELLARSFRSCVEMMFSASLSPLLQDIYVLFSAHKSV